MNAEERTALREACIGKTIADLTVEPEHDYDRLGLTFTDGTKVQIDSQDFYEDRSWLRLGKCQLQRGDVKP